MAKRKAGKRGVVAEREARKRRLERVAELRKNTIKTFSTFIGAAFALVAALAWNTAIQGVFAQLFGTSENSIVAMLSYAIIVTVIAVMVTLYLGRLTGRD